MEVAFKVLYKTPMYIYSSCKMQGKLKFDLSMVC